MSRQSDDFGRQLYGLCLSFHHSDHSIAGSRRFRSLVPLFRDRGLIIDLIIGKNPGVENEPGTYATGSFSPFISTLNWLSRQRSRILQSRTSGRKGVSSAFKNAEMARTDLIDQDSGLRSLILSFEAAPDLNTGWIIPAIRKAIRRRKKYDFIISTAPPWSSHIAAIYIGRRLKAPVILDNRDPWIGNSFRLSFITHPFVRRLDKYLANRCYSRAAGIVCVTEAACRLQENQINSNSALIEYIPHGYDPIFDKYYSVPARSGKLTITHVGSTYHGRSPRL